METSAYKTAKQNIMRWDKVEPIKKFSASQLSNRNEKIPAWLKFSKKYFKRIIKIIIKNPFLWEKLSSMYLFLIGLKKAEGYNKFLQKKE